MNLPQKIISEKLRDLEAAIEKANSTSSHTSDLKEVLFHRFLSKVPRAVRTLGDVCTLEYGEAIDRSLISDSGFLVLGSGGPIYCASRALVSGPGIVIGRKGSVGAVFWSADDFWPLDTAFYVVPKATLNLRWLYWTLSFAGLPKLASATGVPGLSRDDAYSHKLPWCSLEMQDRFTHCIDALSSYEDAAKKVTDQMGNLQETLRARLLTGELRVKP